MAFGLGLGAIAIPVVAQPLIAMFGWRTAYASFGCAALLVSLPVVATFLGEDPKDKGLWPDGTTPAQSAERNRNHLEGLIWRDTWHDPAFWLMISAFFLAGASLFACILHLPA
jgi:MFS family permease